MKELFLNKIRLTYYLYTLFVIYLTVFIFLPTTKFDPAVMTLFSVNSFLYGFYISPILSGQKSRIDELHKIIRSEANSLYGIELKVKKLPAKLRNKIQAMIESYVKKKITDKSSFAEEEYEELITFCLEYKGENSEDVSKLVDLLVANQQNRTMFMLQMNNKVYSNEWMVISILFSITLGVIIMLDVNNIFINNVIKALLCTGLTMLMIILLKLSTLTHKKAKEIWSPFHKLIKSRFYQSC